MKIAICLSGQARCFDFNSTHEMLFPGHEVDYFCFFWDYLLEPNDYTKIHSIYNPKRLVIEPYVDFSSYQEAVPNCGVRAWNTFPMWYAVQEADRLRQQYEKENGFKYDAVIRSRSDNIFNGSWNSALDELQQGDIIFPTLYHFTDWENLPGYNDQLAMGTSDSMSIYSAMFDWFPKAFTLYPGWWGIERLLLYYFEQPEISVNVKKVHIDYKLLRPSERGVSYENLKGYMHPAERQIR